MTIPWWNSDFKIRRPIEISAAVFTDDIHCVLQLKNGFLDSFKSRDDNQDIEIVYYDESSHHVLASEFEILNDGSNDFLNIQFVRYDGTEDLENYHIYMTNPNLRGIDYYRPLIPVSEELYIRPGYPDSYFTGLLDATPSTPIPTPTLPYESNTYYSQEAVPGASQRFTVSRPTEDWVDGVSTRQGATASFNYSGGGCAIRYEAGPNRGIVKITTNSSSEIELDTYSPTVEYKMYYLNDSLASTYNYIHEFYVTGDKSPSASNYTIKLDRMIYTHYDLVSLGSEELATSTKTRNYVVGV